LTGENVRVETLTGDGIAARILDLLAERWFPDHAIVALASEVVRSDKSRCPLRACLLWSRPITAEPGRALASSRRARTMYA
jgi:hypothetical protein